MGSFPKSGEPKFQVHSWFINFILHRIVQWADESKGHSLPMKPLPGLHIISSHSLHSQWCMKGQHGKAWLPEHKGSQAP